MRSVFCTCDYCGQGTHTVRFDGGGYCSHDCASSAELARRRAGREERLRHDAARSRQADKRGALWVGITLVGLFVLIALSGCDSGNRFLDSPGDHVGPDERAHIHAGHSLAEVRTSTRAEITR